MCNMDRQLVQPAGRGEGSRRRLEVCVGRPLVCFIVRDMCDSKVLIRSIQLV